MDSGLNVHQDVKVGEIHDCVCLFLSKTTSNLRTESPKPCGDIVAILSLQIAYSLTAAHSPSIISRHLYTSINEVAILFSCTVLYCELKPFSPNTHRIKIVQQLQSETFSLFIALKTTSLPSLFFPRSWVSCSEFPRERCSECQWVNSELNGYLLLQKGIHSRRQCNPSVSEQWFLDWNYTPVPA